METEITFETAELAKKKGYTDDSNQWSYRDEDGEEFLTNVEGGISRKENTVKIVSQSVLQKWLREKFKINIIVYNLDDPGFLFELRFIGRKTTHKSPKTEPIQFKTYEEALEMGLKSSLNLIRSPKESRAFYPKS